MSGGQKSIAQVQKPQMDLWGVVQVLWRDVDVSISSVTTEDAEDQRTEFVFYSVYNRESRNYDGPYFFEISR